MPEGFTPVGEIGGGAPTAPEGFTPVGAIGKATSSKEIPVSAGGKVAPKPAPKPKASLPPSILAVGEKFAAEAADIADVFLGAPALLAQTAAEVGYGAVEAVKQPFTGESNKKVWSKARAFGQGNPVTRFLSSPAKKALASLGVGKDGDSDATTTSKALGFMDRLVKQGGEWVEKATGKVIPAEAVEVIADSLMSIGEIKGGQAIRNRPASPGKGKPGKGKPAGGSPKDKGKDFLDKLKASADAAAAAKKAREEAEMPAGERLKATLKASRNKADTNQATAEQIAYRLMQRDHSPAQIEAIRKKNPAVGEALDRMMAARKGTISAMKDTIQGEALGPEGDRGPTPLPPPQIRETGFRDTKTGEVTPTGPKHPEEMEEMEGREGKEAGFIDAEEKFLTRHEAAKVVDRKLLVKPPSPKEGLHSSDFGEKGVPDRRVDRVLREKTDTLLDKLSKMEPGEAREALRKELAPAFMDSKTGLPNERAYKEASKKPYQAVVDLDSLKWVNDNMGHEAGDELLHHISRALEGLESYRTGGDEFTVQGDSPEALHEGLKKAQEALKGIEIKSGKVTKKGVDFTYGVGKSVKEADDAMLMSKRDKELRGERAGRGQQPKGVKEEGAPVQEDLFGQTGKVDPKLVMVLAGTSLGALVGMGLLGDPRDQDLMSLVGKAIEGGLGGFLLAQSPSYFAKARYIPKAEFVRALTNKYGGEYKAAAEKMWEEKVPLAVREAPFAKTLDEKADVTDLQFQANAIQGAGKVAQVEAIKGIQQLRAEGWTPEKLEPLWGLEEGRTTLPPGLKGVYENYYKPARESLDDNLREIAKIVKRPLRTVEDEFMPRIALERKGPLQRLLEGHSEFATTGKPSSLEKRSIYSVGLQSGADLVIHVGDKGALTGFLNGEILDLGSTANGKRPSVGDEISLKSGQSLGVMKQATRNQIEAHTNDLRYWKDPVATVLLKRAETSAYLDNLKFFDELKNRPDFTSSIAAKAEKNPPEGWRFLNAESRMKLPMFRDLMVNPRYAEMLEDLTKSRGKIPILTSFNNIATKALLLNPIPHIDNEITHWVMASGISSFLRPGKIGELLPALRSVIKQDDLQMEINKAGGNMLYTGRWLNRGIEALGKGEMALLGKTPEFKSLAAKMGLAVPEALQYFSARTGDYMWMVRDTLVTQLVREKMAKGATVRSATQEVMKDMPSYRLPPRILEGVLGEKLSRGLSKVGQGQLLTAFFRYHYAVYSELGNLAKGVVRRDTRLHALDSAAALAAMWIGYQYIIDPIADYMAKQAGLASGRARRPGPLHAVEKGAAVVSGDPNAGLYLALSIFSPPMWSSIGEAAMGKTVEGQEISNPNAPGYTQLGQRAAYVAQHAVPSVGGGLFNAPAGTSPRTGAQAALQQLDINTKTQSSLDRARKAIKARAGKERKERKKRLGGEGE